MKIYTSDNKSLLKLCLFINYFIFAIFLNSVGTVILQVQISYGVSASSAGVLEAFKDLSIAITSFLIASVVVSIGYKRIMITALSLVLIACLIMVKVEAFWSAKLLFTLVGIGFALIKITTYACIGCLAKTREDHASQMSFLESFFMVGVLAGYFIFSYFVGDESSASTSWLDVYFWLAALAVFAIVVLSLLDMSYAEQRNGDSLSLARQFFSMIALCYKPLVVIFVVSVFIYVLIEQSIMSWMPTFNSSVLSLSPSLSIQMTSILAASYAAGRFLSGIVIRRLNWLYFLFACLFMASALILFVLPLSSGVAEKTVSRWSEAPLAAFLFPMIGFFLAPIYPIINSLLLSSLPQYQHASMSGLIVIFSALGGTTGSVVTGFLFEGLGGETAFYFSLAPIAAMAVSLLWFGKLISKEEQKG